MEIRIGNVSPYDYAEVQVRSPGGDHVYGDVAAGEVSEYREYAFSYRYAFVELKIDGETYTLQPIDYVGETPLAPSTYVFKVDRQVGSVIQDTGGFVLDD